MFVSRFLRPISLGSSNMALTPVLISRVMNEMNMLVSSPPPGISCWPVGDSMIDFEASMWTIFCIFWLCLHV
jgi:hypothetical protein